MSQSIDYHAVKLNRYFINLRKQPTCQTVYPYLDQATLKKIDKFCYPQNIRKSKIKNQNWNFKTVKSLFKFWYFLEMIGKKS